VAARILLAPDDIAAIYDIAALYQPALMEPDDDAIMARARSMFPICSLFQHGLRINCQSAPRLCWLLEPRAPVRRTPRWKPTWI